MCLNDNNQNALMKPICITPIAEWIKSHNIFGEWFSQFVWGWYRKRLELERQQLKSTLIKETSSSCKWPRRLEPCTSLVRIDEKNINYRAKSSILLTEFFSAQSFSVESFSVPLLLKRCHSAIWADSEKFLQTQFMCACYELYTL